MIKLVYDNTKFAFLAIKILTNKINTLQNRISLAEKF